MFQKMKARMLHILPAIVVSVLLVTGVLYAWTEPPVAPPSGNVFAPLNVGSTGQVKQGNLMLNTYGWASALLIPFGRVGIGPVASVDNPTYDSSKLVDLGDSGRIVRVNNPIDAQDVATKSYVDAAGGGSGGVKVVKDSCFGGIAHGSQCTATVDCGVGWAIVGLGLGAAGCPSSLPVSCSIDAARQVAIYNLQGTEWNASALIFPFPKPDPTFWDAFGSQTYSLHSRDAGNFNVEAIATVALCSKQ